MEVKGEKYLTAKETEILKSFPGLSQEDLDGCNDLFQRYMIYQTEKGGRRVWTSCCHRDGELLPWIEQTMTPERNEARQARHNDHIKCPFCGRSVTVKCRGKFRSARSTYERVPVVFLHVSEEGNIYAQAYIAVKDYGERPSAYPHYAFDSAFYFYPGGCMRFDQHWDNQYVCTEEKETLYSKKRILEPFYNGGMSGHDHYKVIYVERLEQSFTKYCNYRRWSNIDAPGAMWCDDMIRWLLCAAVYSEKNLSKGPWHQSAYERLLLPKP